MNEKSYDDLIFEYPKTVILRLRGKFYNAYDEGAMIIGELMDYKVRAGKNNRCKVGFPVEGFDKVMKVITEENINVIAFDGSDVVDIKTYENNQYDNILNRFDKNKIELLDGEVNSREESCSSNEVLESNKLSFKQRTSFIQGQGITLENALMDIQRIIDSLISQNKRIVSISLIENKNIEFKDAVLVQGIVIYEIL